MKDFKILSKDVIPEESEKYKVFEGTDGSLWEYLDKIKTKGSGLLVKHFRLISR